MDKEKNIMRYYRYSVENIELLFDGDEPVKLEKGLVSDIFIEKDYDGDIFPIVNINIGLTSTLYYKVLYNKTKVKIRFRFQKYMLDEDNQPSVKSDIVNDLFEFFLDEDTPFIDKAAYDKREDVDIGDGNTQLEYPNERALDMYLFKISDIDASKVTVNKIIKKGTVADILAYSLTKSGARKVLFSPVNNTDEVKQVVLPTLTTNSIVKLLEEKFGIYRKGAMLFYDLDRVYLIDKNSQCNCWEDQEYKQTVITIAKSMNDISFYPGCYNNEEEKRYEINVTPDLVNITSETVITEQLSGNNITVVNKNNGEVEKVETNLEQHGSGTYNILQNNYNNKYAVETLTTRITEKAKIVRITLGDVDIDALTPNKEFTLVFEESEINSNYGGSYRLGYCRHYFKKSGLEYIVSSDCILYKQ